MMVGVRQENALEGKEAAKQIEELKAFYGIREHHLETLRMSDKL